MVNIDDFIKRLNTVLDYYGLNASSFADKIGVQRSTISHLLSGRNKPSLDFVLKIREVFPDVDLYWMLNGEGNFPKKNEEVLTQKKEPSAEIDLKSSPISLNENTIVGDLFSETNFQFKEKEAIQNILPSTNKVLNSDAVEIEKIVFFYKNGTFKVYNP